MLDSDEKLAAAVNLLREAAASVRRSDSAPAEKAYLLRRIADVERTIAVEIPEPPKRVPTSHVLDVNSLH